MASTLLDHMRSTFTATAVTDLAQVLNENTASTQKAVDGLLPAITSGVINRASEKDGASTLYQLLKTTPFDTDPSLARLAETDDHRRKAAESGNDILRRLFGDSASRLADTTAQYSGIKTGSAATLAGIVMSVLMGYLHKQMTTRNLTEPQLVGLLQGEADSTRAAVPAALAGLLGWFIGTGTVRPVTTTTTTVPVSTPVTPVRTDDDRGGTPWWRWLLLALGLLLLFLLITRMCNRDETSETAGDGTSTSNAPVVVPTDTLASDTVGSAGSAGAMTGDSASGDEGAAEVRVGVDLPGGRRLNVAENSFNYELAKFLAVKGGQVPKIFTFDNLTFETNSARITAKAQPNVNDLIQIMQAYPSLNIRIEGNTDSTGPEALNDPLSADRADAVKAALVKAGIDAGRVATRERGETKPVATNETEAGREKNRRIDVVVTKV